MPEGDILHDTAGDCSDKELLTSRLPALESDGRWNKEIDTRIDEANAVLCELSSSVVTKRELSNTVKLSGFKWVFVQILPYGHDSWVMTEIILSQVQTAEMGFLRRVYDVTLGDKVHNCEMRILKISLESYVWLDPSRFKAYDFAVLGYWRLVRIAVADLPSTKDGQVISTLPSSFCEI